MRATALRIAVALSTLAAAGSTARADSGLVGYWKMDEGAGTRVADSSGYANDGRLVGAVSWIPDASTSALSGSDSALSFAGSSGYIDVPDNSSLEPPLSVSVGAWFRRLGTPGEYKYLLAKGAAGCIAASYGLYTGPNGGLEFYASRQHGTVYAHSPDAGRGVWDGRWHLAVGTFDGTTIRLYLDGTQVGSGTPYPGLLEYPLATSNDLFIGDYPGCSSRTYAFAGDLDDVAVWNQPLSGATIKQMAEGDASPLASGGSPTTRGISASSPAGTGQAGTARGPALKLLFMQPSRFSPSGSHRAGTGTTISYIDSEASRSTFTVLRRRRGVERGRRCVPPRGGDVSKHAIRCSAYVLVARFTRKDRAGTNRFHFGGFIAGRRLSAGTYLLEVVPRTAGRVGSMASVVFQIIR
jgi:hypothetical protein